MTNLLWPKIRNEWDVNDLGRQGFWLCLIIALFQLIAAAIVPDVWMRLLAVLSAVVFVVGAMGIREANWPAAALMFVFFAITLGDNIVNGRMPSILHFIAGLILLSNVRAAFLASRWQPIAEGDIRPSRPTRSFGDRLANRIPSKWWPRPRVAFFAVATLLVLFTFLDFAIALQDRMSAQAAPVATQP
jgi:hypothetical protein